MTVLLGLFLIHHLWKFDRFRSLKWNHGPSSGAFKRIMTYTYMLTIPLVGIFAIGFAIIKYQTGYSFVPGYGIIPTPYELWPESARRAAFPLQLLFSIGWSFEMVTHLEELCFWMFLINAGSIQRDWFHSLYFKTWIVGAVIAVTYMPLVTTLTRSDPLRCEGAMFLSGALGGLILTIWFVPILWVFPKFLDGLKREGVDMNTLIKLTTFYELNTIRVIFRFLMVIPLLILGFDGVTPHHHVNSSSFWTELLPIISSIGCVVSSGITLVIFFPRSIRGEIEAKQAANQGQSRVAYNISHPEPFESIHRVESHASEVKDVSSFNDYHGRELDIRRYSVDTTTSTFQGSVDAEAGASKAMVSFAPNRRLSTGATVEGHVTVVNLTEQNLMQQNARPANVHPFINNFTSPIDLMQGPGASYAADAYTVARVGRR